MRSSQQSQFVHLPINFIRKKREILQSNKVKAEKLKQKKKESLLRIDGERKNKEVKTILINFRVVKWRFSVMAATNVCNFC